MKNVGIELAYELNELSSRVKGITLIAAELTFMDTSYKSTQYSLAKNHIQEDARQFFSALENLSYDEGYGTQYLFGIVWLSNGYWLTREEYDGSEWWQINHYPDIPEELQ